MSKTQAKHGKGPKQVLVVTDLSRSSRRDFLSGFFFAVDSGYDWNIHIVQSAEGFTETAVRKCIDDGIDGIVLLECWDRKAVECLEASDVPVVAVGARTNWFSRRQTQITFLHIDDERLGAFAASYLARLGHHNSYVFVPASRGDLWSAERERGYRAALAQHGAKALTWNPAEHGPLAGFLKALAQPIAVFAACDRIAADAMAELQGSGLSVPGQVSLLGTDDDRLICHATHPRLSSIRPGHFDEGAAAARELKALMAAREPMPRRSMTCAKMELSERASTAFVKPAAQLVSNAREFIAHHAVRGITPDDVARHLGVSRRLLDLRFSQLADMSVAQAIRKVKMDTLKSEIRNSKTRLFLLADQCGFKSSAYLKKAFLAETGMTMTEWRRSKPLPRKRKLKA